MAKKTDYSIQPVPTLESVPARKRARLSAEFQDIVETLGEPTWRGDDDFPGDPDHQRLSWRCRETSSGAVVCMWDWDAESASATANTKWNVFWVDGPGKDGSGRKMCDRVVQLIRSLADARSQEKVAFVEARASWVGDAEVSESSSTVADEIEAAGDVALPETATEHDDVVTEEDAKVDDTSSEMPADTAEQSDQSSQSETQPDPTDRPELNVTAPPVEPVSPQPDPLQPDSSQRRASQFGAAPLNLDSDREAVEQSRRNEAETMASRASQAAEASSVVKDDLQNLANVVTENVADSFDEVAVISKEYASRMRQEMEEVRQRLERSGQRQGGQLKEDMLQYCAEKVVTELSEKHKLSRSQVVSVINKAFGGG